MISPEYLYVWQIWLILGVGCMMLEFIDGSSLLFLPLGIGGLGMTILLGLVETGFLPIEVIPEQWIFMLLIWAGLSLVAAFGLAAVRQRRSRRSKALKDINDY